MIEQVDQQKLIETEKSSRYPWFVLMGIPCSGKTTIGQVLSEKLNSKFFTELNPKDIRIFNDYYRDPVKYSLPIQLLFLQSSYNQIVDKEKGIKNILKVGPVVSEPLIDQHSIFARARLNENEMKYYQDYFDCLVSPDSFPKPDLVFYLKPSLELQGDWIKKRAEEFPERKIELEAKQSYWEDLSRRFDLWVGKNRERYLIQEIRMDRFNPNKYSSKEESTKGILRELMNWLHYYICVNVVTQEKFQKRILPDIVKVPPFSNNDDGRLPFHSLHNGGY